MATSKKFSELTAASSLTANDLAAVAHVDAQAETGYESQKATMSQLGQYLNKEMQYATDLSKFPVGSQSPIPALNNLRDFLYGQLPVNSASGSIANFTTSLALPLVNLKAYITAQGGGGTPASPIPIVGVSEVNVTRAGKNLLDYDSVDSIAVDISSTMRLGVIFKGVGTFTIKSHNTTSARITIKVKTGSTYSAYDPVQYDNTYYTATKTLTSADELLIYISDTTVTTEQAKTLLSKTMLEFGSQATAYEPYNPQSDTFTINLGQTIYGGYVSQDNDGHRQLVITTRYFKVTTVGEVTDSQHAVIYLGSANRAISTDYQEADLKCNIFKSTEYSTVKDNRIYFSNIQYIHVLTTEEIGTTKADWETYFSNHDCYISYILQSSAWQTIPLADGVPINALVGENNIWADTGNIEVSFKMGVQEYIDAKIAETQALIL